MIICVTNRILCRDDFLVRLEEIAAARPWGILLREKDLAAEEYATLAMTCSAICQRHQTRLLVHSHPALAEQLPSRWLHLPFVREEQAGRAPHKRVGTQCRRGGAGRDGRGSLPCRRTCFFHSLQTGTPAAGDRVFARSLPERLDPGVCNRWNERREGVRGNGGGGSWNLRDVRADDLFRPRKSNSGIQAPNRRS